MAGERRERIVWYLLMPGLAARLAAVERAVGLVVAETHVSTMHGFAQCVAQGQNRQGRAFRMRQVPPCVAWFGAVESILAMLVHAVVPHAVVHDCGWRE